MPIKVRGLKELQKALNVLPSRVAKKHLTASVRQGARLIGKDARDRAPVITGRLRRNIFWYKLRGATRYAVSFGVSIRRKGHRDDPRNAHYGFMVELGTRYKAAKPFLRPAFEANKRRAVGVIARELGRRLQEEAKKL